VKDIELVCISHR